MKLTYTNADHYAGSPPPIPKDPSRQIALLEHTVADLIEALLNEIGGDNPGDIIDRVCADECCKIAWRAWDRSVARSRK
jgi:hypothetical protein